MKNNLDIQRQDLVDNAIFDLLQKVNPSNETIEWDIELIGEVRDVLSKVFVEKLKLTSDNTFYPNCQ